MIGHPIGYYAEVVTGYLAQALTALRHALPAIGIGLTGLSAIHLKSRDRSKVGAVVGIGSGLGLLGLSTVDPEDAIAAVRAMLAQVMQ